MRWNKVVGRLLMICVFLSVIQTNVFSLEDRVYTIENEEDLILLAQNCTLDTYSQGLKVILNTDIQFGDDSFRGIPTFGGMFNGRNHTISGVNMTHEGSTVGLFRYIQTTGVVQNLNVEVNLQLTGTENRIGGIAGENRGIIENCEVYGILSGKNHIGGIAGKNESTGQILDCRFAGKLIGENFSGGIAGENFGLIKNCKNKGAVNTTVTPSTLHIEDIKINEINSAESIVSSTNSGGITGFNRGIIEGCVNEGVIGYLHAGYNVGGIAGRQDGYIGSSVNHGTIFGRKDVGGIAGQMEPYQAIKSDEDFFKELEQELDSLQEFIDNTYDQVDISNEEVSSQLEDVNRSIANVADRMEILSDKTVDYADENIETINDTLDRIHNVVVDLESTTTELKAGTEDFSAGLKDMNVGFICMSMAAEDIEKGFGEIGDGLVDISIGVDELKEGASQMEQGFDHLDAALSNNESLDLAIKEINGGMEHMNDGFDALMGALIKLTDILAAAEDPLHADLDEIVDQTKDDLESARTSFNLASEEMSKALIHLQEEYEKDSKEISLAMTYFREAASYFQTSLDYINKGIDDFNDAATYFENASKMAGYSIDNFSHATQDFEKASDHLTAAIDQINQSLNREAKLGAPQFSLLGESVDAAKKELFVSGDKLIAEISELNQISKSTVDMLTADLRAINDQVFVVIDLIKKGYRNAMDEDREVFKDISDEEMLAADAEKFKDMEPTFGYVLNCVNVGSINGDINVGGIAGTLAIDYDFDPEGDLTSTEGNLMHFQFQTKGVLAECKNTGLVTAKKDYSGGIVGRMDLGSLFECFNNSEVVSSDGNYVGGIAGGSYSVIRNSYSLSHLSGLDYIGGIAGFGTGIVGCTSMITIDKAVEFIGMIAGDVQDGVFGENDKEPETESEMEFEEEELQPVIANNVFVGGKWAAIDGVSYSQKAEPIAYEQLLEDENLPTAFKQLKLTFVADETVFEYPFEYTDGIEVKDLPEIPKKPGYFGQWPEYDYDQLVFPDTIIAEYMPLEQVLASDEGDGVAKLLTEGTFTPGTTLEMTMDHEIERDLLTDMNKISQWHVEIKNNEIANEGYTFRYHTPEHKEYELYAWVGNGWQSLDTVWDGSYLVFQWPKEQFVFMVYEKEVDIRVYIGVAMLVLAIALFLVLKKKRKKRLSQKS